MCSLCLQSPCHPRCPNTSEPKPVLYCRKCRKGMCVGDKHYDGICKECLDDMCADEWLELFEESMEMIEEE
ncbi:hypothetical protein [Parablautia sp. Marseille-Q6255]|uniref:hypothetical protein n=1 Tax=Parablautia sp. Marseille-Q6255 TaxID=3039593 RepID=UPI0024BC7A89|nr:hypothetical protein [Parablautia sp. Marseille-Q6255]